MKNCVITTDYAFDATYIWVDFPFLTCHLPLEESSPPPLTLTCPLPVPYLSLTFTLWKQRETKIFKYPKADFILGQPVLSNQSHFCT